MKMQKIVVVLIGLMLLFAGKASAQQVKTDYDRSANFAQYKTYSWEHVKTQDTLDVDRIKSAVNAALAAKGWTQVDSGGDVSIVAVEMTRDQQTLNTFYNGFGGGWGWRRFGGGGFGDATTTTETYKVGTVVVDLFDTKTKQLIWRGTTSDTLSNKSDKNIKNLDKGVEKMFKNFPQALRRNNGVQHDSLLVRRHSRARYSSHTVACGQQAARRNGQSETGGLDQRRSRKTRCSRPDFHRRSDRPREAKTSNSA